MVEVKTPDVPKEPLRAYLQRAEVRLSTMHRIAGAFISGAGLLILLPLFLKDALAAIANVFLSVGSMGSLSALLIIPVTLAFFIPLVAMYLLLKDLILFYFSASIPEPEGQPGRSFHPRFALTAIPFANDEGDRIKTYLRQLQFEPPLSNFLLPHDEREKNWLSKLMQDPQAKRVALPEGDWLAAARRGADFDRLRLAFGLAGAYDRTLVEEVAKTELSLIRHNLLLRRLVMRYMKALILFIWTALVLFGLVSWLGGQQQLTPVRQQLLALTISFLLWSSLAPLWVRAPVRWIYREFDQNMPDRTRDPHLAAFEHFVVLSCLVATVLATVMMVWPLDSRFGWWLGSVGLVLNVLSALRSFGYLDRLRFV